MRYFTFLFILFFSCAERGNDVASIIDSASLEGKDTLKVAGSMVIADSINNNTDSADSPDPEMDEMQLYHFIAVAEGLDYDSLNALAAKVADKLKTKKDYINRIYKEGKGIIVSMDDEDEIYRGEYYPRRFQDTTVSIEMKYAFSDSTEKIIGNDLRMVLVAGMYEKKEDALKILDKLKKDFPRARVISNEFFVGCMH
ncbi:MAG: hypothetical protein K2X86_18785 [Cytophagaceae bacterium]|nr:hypothetical protein [Cytophagaceae bacterium]